MHPAHLSLHMSNLALIISSLLGQGSLRSQLVVVQYCFQHNGLISYSLPTQSYYLMSDAQFRCMLLKWKQLPAGVLESGLVQHAFQRRCL